MSTQHSPNTTNGGGKIASAVKAAYEKLSRGGTASRANDGTRAGESTSNSPIKHQEELASIATAFSQLLGKPYVPILQVDATKSPIRVPARRQLSQIPHYRQLETWDCGVACIQMVLRWLRPDEYPPINDSVEPSVDEMVERKWIIDSVETQSIWTIDIVIALQRAFDPDLRRLFDFPLSQRHDDTAWNKACYVFFSNKLGCDTAYSQFGYYAKAFDNDEARVTKRFTLAKELNLPIVCVSRLNVEFVIDLISRDECVAIVLLDNTVLKQSDKEYAGHYVLLVGVSAELADIAKAEAKCSERLGSSFCLAIKNPADADCIDYITPALFERAWRAGGTDDDIIFIAKR